jgi:hypothetical protein
MSIKTRVQLIAAIDSLLDQIEITSETRAIGGELYSLATRNDRSMIREKNWKAKRPGGENSITMPPSHELPKEAFGEQPVKKKELKQTPIVETANEPEPIEVDQEAPTNAMEVFDLHQEGLEAAIQKYPKVGEFKKYLKSIEINATGKTHQELWEAVVTEFNKINS